MRAFSLAVDEGFILANLNQRQCGAINLVLGNHKVNDLLNSVYASIQEDIQDMCAYEHVVGGNLQAGRSFKNLYNAWDSIIHDTYALALFDTLLKTIEPEFKEMALCDDGGFSVRIGACWCEIDSTSDSFQYIVEVALQAQSASLGVVIFHTIEKAGVSNIKALIVYLMDMGRLRENRVILSTKSMECVKAFNAVAIERTDIDSVMVKIKGSTPDNCDILAQAAIEQDLSNTLLEVS